MSNVDHPSHYNQEGKKECIDEMVDIFGVKNTIMFALLNSYKYMYRDGLKESAKDDQDKALWYLAWAARNLIKYNLVYGEEMKHYNKVFNLYEEKYGYFYNKNS